MATATETIELQQREPVDVPKDDRSDTAIVGSQQTWKVPSINKYRVPVTFWSLAVRTGEGWMTSMHISSILNRKKYAPVYPSSIQTNADYTLGK